MDIIVLLQQAVLNHASDIFVVAGLPVSYRANGRICREKKEKLMRIMTYGYKSGIGYTDWGWKDGVYQPVGRYIQYPKNSNRQTFWKTYSNRKIRRYKGNIRKGNSYRRHFDYAWEVD